MTQLPQGLGLDLPDAFAGNVELLAHLFQGAAAAVLDAEAQLEHFLLPGSQGGQHVHQLLFEQRKRMDMQNPLTFKNTIRDCGMQIAANLTYEERLQLLGFLANIARSDNNVCREEIEALKEVAAYMGLSEKEVESMLNLGGNSLDAAYKVLEIDPTATDEEVRATYRKLVLKHHPDRVATLGEDIKRAAEEKLQSINNAKEIIYKARGMK